MSAIKFKSDKGLAIEHINPAPFKKDCNIAYYLPNSGRVWLQISNEQGNIILTQNFEAQQGKNVRVFKDEHNLEAGNYTLSLIFENKKVSTQMIKM